MKKIIILVVSGVLAAAGTFSYLSVIKSPKYTLYKIKKAYEQHDLDAFNKYVDIDNLVSRLIEQSFDISENDSANESKSSAEEMGEALGKGLVTMFKSKIVELAKDQVVKFVEKGAFETQNNSDADFSFTEIVGKGGFSKSNYKGMSVLNKEGKLTYLGLNFINPRYDTTLSIVLKMRKRDGYWQLSEISNYSDFMSTVNRLEEKKTALLNAPIIDKINQSLSFKLLRKRSISGSWGFDKKTYIEYALQNTFDKAIDSLSFTLVLKSKDNKTIKEITTSYTKTIDAKAKVNLTNKIDINMFMAEDDVLFKTPFKQLTAMPVWHAVYFADGSSLKLFSEFDHLN